LPDILEVPLLSEMAPGGFAYGRNYLVEFDPHSLWYEASLTIASQLLKRGIKTDYHTFTHIPGEVREALARLGLNVRKMEDDSTLRIVDSFTVTTLLKPESIEKSTLVRTMEKSLSLKDWERGDAELLKEAAPESEKKRFHIDDNTSTLVSYNDEKSFVDHWRTNGIPTARIFEWSILHSAVTGALSESFYRQFESLCDGVIDFRSQEENETIGQYTRIRMMRGKSQDSRWRRLRLLNNGEVAFDHSTPKAGGLGIRAWLKGPKKI